MTTQLGKSLLKEGSLLPIATGYIQAEALVTQTGGLGMTLSKGGTGIYGIAFATPLPDANYYIIATCTQGDTWNGGGRLMGVGESNNPVKNAAGFQLRSYLHSGSGSGVLGNAASIAFAIYKY